MYAVIRAGGKQYRVAPGDVIRVEKLATGTRTARFEFSEVLAVSGRRRPDCPSQSEARVIGQVVEQGRGDKILVFHYKRKKQYKKLRGHRQPFTAVRITEIAFDGQRFKAPEPSEEGSPSVEEGWLRRVAKKRRLPRLRSKAARKQRRRPQRRKPPAKKKK